MMAKRNVSWLVALVLTLIGWQARPSWGQNIKLTIGGVRTPDSMGAD